LVELSNLQMDNTSKRSRLESLRGGENFGFGRPSLRNKGIIFVNGIIVSHSSFLPNFSKHANSCGKVPVRAFFPVVITSNDQS